MTSTEELANKVLVEYLVTILSDAYIVDRGASNYGGKWLWGLLLLAPPRR